MLTVGDWQWVGRDFLLTHPRAFLLDDTGVGKTIETIIAHDASPDKKAIIFCENNKLYDWEIEYKAWAPKINRFLVCGDRRGRFKIYDHFAKARPPATLIVNHHKVIFDLDNFLDLKSDIIAIDEAEVFNNVDTKLNQHMVWSCRNTPFVWQLSAQPFGINLYQFYNLFLVHGLAKQLFGTPFMFIDRFCEVDVQQFRIKGKMYRKRVIVGAKNVVEFKEIIRPYCLRRTLASAGVILPPVRFNALGCFLTKRQKRLYTAAKKNQLDMMTRKEKFEPISRYQFITQILNSPHLLDETDSFDSPKLDEAIKHFHKHKEKVVMFTQFLKWFPEIVKRLNKEGIPVIQYYGTGMSAKKKHENEMRFKDATVPTVFLCTEAAKRGINLQHCHILYVLDFLFNPVDLLQLFGRLDRVGQKNDISIYYFVMYKTHEEKIFDKLYQRQGLIDEVLNDNKASCFNLRKLFEETLRSL